MSGNFVRQLEIEGFLRANMLEFRELSSLYLGTLQHGEDGKILINNCYSKSIRRSYKFESSISGNYSNEDR